MGTGLQQGRGGRRREKTPGGDWKRGRRRGRQSNWGRDPPLPILRKPEACTMRQHRGRKTKERKMSRG